MSKAWKEILCEFEKRMQTQCTDKRYEFMKSPLGRQNVNLYVLTTKDKNGKWYWLFIHVSTSVGFWGVSADWQGRINDITQKVQSAHMDWAVVLLNTPEEGYLICSDEFLKLIKHLYVGGYGKGQIKILERDLKPMWRFNNLETIFEKLTL